MPKTEWLLSAPLTPTNPKAGTPLFRFLVRLMRRENLSEAEAEDFFRQLIDPNANPVQAAGALVALTAKGETAEELAGMARVMRENAFKISTRHKNLIDLTGTGSSAAKVFNVSTAAAIVAAGAGLPVAKHTSGAVLSHSGSSDVLTKLGIKAAAEPEIAQACLNGAGICFMFAPKFHPALKRIGEIRSNLGIRSCLNLLGVLSNPADAPLQLVGVWHPSLLDAMAEALKLLGTKRAWVVHGADGLDEITLDGETYVLEVLNGQISRHKFTPEDFGLHSAKIGHLKASTPSESAKIIGEVLRSQRRDEARSLVVINAAAALLIGGIAKEPMHAARLAEQSIDSGSALTKLERLIQTTNKR